MPISRQSQDNREWTLNYTYPIGVGCITAASYGYGEENSSLLKKEWVEMVDKEW